MNEKGLQSFKDQSARYIYILSKERIDSELLKQVVSNSSPL